MKNTIYITIVLLFTAIAPAMAQDITIAGYVYGGGKAANVGSTVVTVNDGIFCADIFGGGEGALNNDGTVKASADVSGTTTVTVMGGKFDVEQVTEGDETGKLKQNYNVYGGGNLACVVGTLNGSGQLVDNTGNTTVTLNASMLPKSFFKAEAGSSQYRMWGETYAQHHADKAIQGSVFGAGYGKNTQVLGNTNVNINIGEATTALAAEDDITSLFALAKRGGDATGETLASKFVITALGGGYDGTVSGNTNVTIQGSPMLQNVFGGGLGSKSGAANSPTSEVGTVNGGAYVNILGGTIYGDVFGGGAGISGEVDNIPYYKAGWVRRETAVKIGKDEKDIKGITIFGNIYGGGDIANTGWYTEAVKPLEAFSNSDMNLTNALVATSIHLNAGNVLGDVFAGGNGRAMWYDGYTGPDFRTHRPEIIGSMCGSTLVQVDGATVWGDIYGGGKTGRILTPTASRVLNNNEGDAARSGEGSTYVYIKSGKVGKNIYGGGLGDIANNNNTVTAANVLGNTIVFFENAELPFTKYWNNLAGQFSDQDNAGDKRGTATDVLHNLYGGGNLACSIGTAEAGVLKYGGDTRVLMKGSPSVADLAALKDNAYFQRASQDVGLPHFSAFGGGYGTQAVVLGNAKVDVELVNGSGFFEAIGGGLNGPIMGSTTVNINTNDKPIHGVYGGGYYAKVHKGTTVNITNAQITEDVFGGGALGDIGKTDDISIKLNISGGTISGNVYGANDVSGTVEGLVKVNITGGTIMKNVYGAGNGDHIGYYEPGRGHYDVGENDNYYVVDHSGEGGPSGNTYKGRPQTTGGVALTLAGNSTTERVKVLGQVFGGGNSCTIGEWVTPSDGDAHHGNPHEWRDDPDFFKGGGTLNITLGSHVTIGRTNAELAALKTTDKDTYKAYTNEDEDNVSGLFMGNNGKNLATQNTSTTDYYYHHYYDAKTKKYWPGFVVYKNEEGHYDETVDRSVGLATFNAYLNNILMWTDNVTLTIADNAEDIRLANFVGGGFRGSMKAKTASKKFSYTLPNGVTIGNAVVGGAYNTDVVYRIFDTSDGHTYTTKDGHYQYLTTVGSLTKYDKNTNPNGDYHHIEYAEDGETIKGIVRFNYEGGIISHNNTTLDTDIAELNLGCNFETTPETYVYGGCFTSGSIYGNTKIDYHATNADKVFGGGYGVEAIVKGNTRVDVTEGATTSYVFGGGAEAKVNNNTQVNIKGGSVSTEVYGGGALANVEGNTVVNLTGGSIGSAYGGGLGDATTSALVYGNAMTTLNGSVVNGSIFGANNVNGTPLGHVKVHVQKTKASGGTYHVAAVYGGGNQAAYVPTGSYNTEGCLTDNTKYAEVLIEGCDNSIEFVYGGGNAAPVPATDVTIYGGTISKAFAGGNGQGDGNKGADIGYLGFYSETGEGTPKYGVGTTKMTIYGGTIEDVYGGSNTLGYIRTNASVSVDKLPDGYTGDVCPLNVTNVHGGGNAAPMYCNGSVTLNCTKGVDVIFGGAQNADIHGNVELNITSGTYKQVFTGNDSGGNIYGSLKVNIDETGCWPIIIGELYGCGNNAAYSVYGYNNDGTCKTVGEKRYDDPVVNVVSCTSIGKVFGAGKGETAVVYGDPTVNINTIEGAFAGQTVGEGLMILDGDVRREATETERTIPNDVGTIGTIYGGGNAGAVYGSTEVKIGTLEKNKHISGTDKTTEHEVAVTITGNVFGGGNEAIVSGDTHVTIGQ